MTSQIFSIIMVLLALSGCNTLQNRDVAVMSDNAKTLVKSTKSLDVEIDSLTVNRSMQLGYFHSDKPWLFNLNWKANEIQMYSLEDKSLYKTLKFPVEGDGGVGHIFSFYVHTLDSIFIFPQSKPTIFLTDRSQVIRKEIAYQIPEMYTPAFVHSTHFSSPPVIMDGEFVVKTRPEDNFNEMTDRELSKRNLIFKINLSNGKSELLPHRYPSNYLKDGYRMFDFSFAKGRDKWVYSFHSDHNLYYSELMTSELIPVDAKSKYIDRFQNF